MVRGGREGEGKGRGEREGRTTGSGIEGTVGLLHDLV